MTTIKKALSIIFVLGICTGALFAQYDSYYDNQQGGQGGYQDPYGQQGQQGGYQDPYGQQGGYDSYGQPQVQQQNPYAQQGGKQCSIWLWSTIIFYTSKCSEFHQTAFC